MNWSLAYRYSGITSVLMILAAALILALPGARAQAPKADTAPTGNAQTGKRIFTSYGCYECHGLEAQGSQAPAPAGPRIGPRPIPFAAFLSYNRQPKDQMPPYTSKVVSDAELADIYAFLQSLPQPPPAKSVPLLNN